MHALVQSKKKKKEMNITNLKMCGYNYIFMA